MSATPPELSVIVVNWNTQTLVRHCLDSVDRHLSVLSHEVIVVDNASTDGSVEMLQARYPQVRLIANSENVGFARANNQAMEVSRGAHLLLLNSDASLIDASIVGLLAWLRDHDQVGLVGPQLRFPSGAVQPSAFRFLGLRLMAIEELGLYKLMSRRQRGRVLLSGYWDHSCSREVDWVLGACMLTRREVYARTGGLDSGIFLLGEDEDWCRRIRANGWQVHYSTLACVAHVGHASTVQLLGERGRVERGLAESERQIARWEGRLAARLVPVLRVTGALLRIAVSLLRIGRAAHDDSARVRAQALVVLGYYGRRCSLWR